MYSTAIRLDYLEATDGFKYFPDFAICMKEYNLLKSQRKHRLIAYLECLIYLKGSGTKEQQLIPPRYIIGNGSYLNDSLHCVNEMTASEYFQFVYQIDYYVAPLPEKNVLLVCYHENIHQDD